MGWFTRKPKAPAPGDAPDEPSEQPAPAQGAQGARSPLPGASPLRPHPPPPGLTEGGSLAPIVARWDAAIADIERRWDATLEQAVAASDRMLASGQGDMEPLTRSWGPVEHQMHQLTDEVSERWDQISDLLSEECAGEEVMQREGGKLDLASCELEIRYQRAFRATMARAAELMRERALASADPASAMRVFAASGALFIGQRAAQASWEAMRRAETRINNYRDKRAVPLALLEELESTARGHWTTLFTTEAELVPELQRYVAAKIESSMKSVEKTLRQFWQWREAKK